MRSTIVGAGGVILLLFGAFLFFQTRSANPPPSPQTLVSPTPVFESKEVDITASFTIKTDAIVRSFKAAKYHNQSPDVFITSDNPTRVHVTKKGITWSDFFTTLPMKLTKDCLITGDGETLCDGQQGTLKFYVNDKEDKDLLGKEIKESDRALITFTSSNPSQ